MADDILVDLNDLSKDAVHLGTQLGATEQGQMLQVLATVAVAERLDRLHNLADEIWSWVHATSPQR